jgi:hypothetical protein
MLPSCLGIATGAAGRLHSPLAGAASPGNPAPTIRAREVLDTGLGPPDQDLPASRDQPAFLPTAPRGRWKSER